MFKANVISLFSLFTKKTNVYTGNDCSALLTNVYFHDLDIFIKENIIERYKKGIKPTTSPKYQHAISFVYLEKKASSQKRQVILRKKRKKVYNMGYECSTSKSKYIRVNYLRYLGNALIGVRGPKVLTKKIFKTIHFFFKSNLQLNLDEKKSQILNSFSNKVSFLGVLLYSTFDEKIYCGANCGIQNKK
jgi:hypothetical protein